MKSISPKSIDSSMAELPIKKRNPFAPQEDRLLFALIQRYETSSWKEISQNIPGRSCRQRGERYIEYLSPDLVNKLGQQR
jgi:hypothetical protein